MLVSILSFEANTNVRGELCRLCNSPLLSALKTAGSREYVAKQCGNPSCSMPTEIIPYALQTKKIQKAFGSAEEFWKVRLGGSTYALSSALCVRVCVVCVMCVCVCGLYKYSSHFFWRATTQVADPIKKIQRQKPRNLSARSFTPRIACDLLRLGSRLKLSQSQQFRSIGEFIKPSVGRLRVTKSAL